MYHRQIIDIHSLKLPVPINRGGECARFCGSKKIEASIFWLDLSRSWMLLEQRLFRSREGQQLNGYRLQHSSSRG